MRARDRGGKWGWEGFCGGGVAGLRGGAKYSKIARWKGGRVVDGTGLENQQVNSFAGSNPVPSARKVSKK